MLTHSDIWHAIDRLAEQSGYSTSGLARRAGLDPTTFNKSKRFSSDGKERWPSTESIAKILTTTATSMPDFVALIPSSPPSPAQTSIIPSGTVPSRTIDDVINHPTILDDQGHPTGSGWTNRTLAPPANTMTPACFAIEINNDNYIPTYRRGDILLVLPGAPIRDGDRVIISTNDNNQTWLGEILRQTATRIDLIPLGQKATPIEIPHQNIRLINRVIWSSQ